MITHSNPDPLHFPHAYIIIAPVIQARGFRVRVPGHALCDLDAPAVGQVVRNPRGAEGVAAYPSFNAGVGSTAADHVPDIRARHCAPAECLCLADRGAEQRAIAVAAEACRLDIGVKVAFQLVMAAPGGALPLPRQSAPEAHARQSEG
jgi:hypothetical protein